jgi:hypothetical protein
MIEIKINGDNATIKKRGTIKELSNDYLKLLLTIIESFSFDSHIPRGDCLEFFYQSIREIYENEETIIKEGD